MHEYLCVYMYILVALGFGLFWNKVSWIHSKLALKYLLSATITCVQLNSMKEIQTMANMIRSSFYRYFSFTYFYGKAYLGLAESVRV